MYSLDISASFEYRYVMGLQPLQLYYSFRAGIDFRRLQILTSKVAPRAVTCSYVVPTLTQQKSTSLSLQHVRIEAMCPR